MSTIVTNAGSWLLVLVGLAILIIIHEGGHFMAAKATGMRVEGAYLFFGPKLVTWRRGETEYGVRAIPLGGYVKITGMNPDEVKDLPEDVQARAYYRQKVWKRIVTIGAGPAMNILFAFLILFVLAFGAQKGTYLKVDAVQKKTPAERVLQPGDRLISVDGYRPQGGSLSDDAQRFADIVNSHKCAGGNHPGCETAPRVRLVVKRDGKLVVLHPRPFFDPKENRYRLGFQFGEGGLVAVNPNPAQAAGTAGSVIWTISSKTVSAISRIFEPEQRKQVSGIVGVSDVAHQTIDFGARAALTLLAIISLSLALINLFPFLPLDGGHIFWSLVEKVRGKPVPFRVMEQAGVIGFILVLMLFVIGLTNDINRLTGEGFHVR